MKKLMTLAAVMIAFNASVFAAKPAHSIKVVSKQMDVVYFKVSCDLIGGSIEVLDANGAVIYSAKVTDHKVLVDFYAEPSGSYTIHIKKDCDDESIEYVKESISHSELAAHSFVTVTQM